MPELVYQGRCLACSAPTVVRLDAPNVQLAPNVMRIDCCACGRKFTVNASRVVSLPVIDAEFSRS